MSENIIELRQAVKKSYTALRNANDALDVLVDFLSGQSLEHYNGIAILLGGITNKLFDESVELEEQFSSLIK